MFLLFIICGIVYLFMRYAYICHKAKKEILAFEKARQEYRTYWAKKGVKTKGYICPRHIAENIKYFNA